MNLCYNIVVRILGKEVNRYEISNRFTYTYQ